MQKVAKQFFLISFFCAVVLASMFLFGIRSLAKKLPQALSMEILGHVYWLEFLGSVLITALVAWQLGKYFRTSVREEMIKMVELVWVLCGVIGAILLCLIHAPVGIGVLFSLTVIIAFHWSNELRSLGTSVPKTTRKIMDRLMNLGKGETPMTFIQHEVLANPTEITEIEISSVPTHMH